MGRGGGGSRVVSEDLGSVVRGEEGGVSVDGREEVVLFDSGDVLRSEGGGDLEAAADALGGCVVPHDISFGRGGFDVHGDEADVDVLAVGAAVALDVTGDLGRRALGGLGL